jgi:hypothetical protein
MSKHAVVQAAELELLESATRGNAVRLEELLHPEFGEIGRSGRQWARTEVIAALAGEARRPAPEADEWGFVDLAEELVLVTYRLRTGTRQSRHSSVWDTSAGAARLRFHQGTVIPAEFQ